MTAITKGSKRFLGDASSPGLRSAVSLISESSLASPIGHNNSTIKKGDRSKNSQRRKTVAIRGNLKKELEKASGGVVTNKNYQVTTDKEKKKIIQAFK